MAKKSNPSSSLSETILDIFIKNGKKEFNAKQVASVLGMRDEKGRILIDKALNKLVGIGKIKLIGPGRYKLISFDRFVEGVLDVNSRGSAYLIQEGDENDVFIAPADLNRALHKDKVRVCLFAARKDGRSAGEVVEILERARTEFVGVVERKAGFAFLVPDDRHMHVDLYIPNEKLNGVQNGYKAIARITDWPEDFNNPFGEIIQVLGKPGNNEVEMNAIIAEFGFPLKFPEQVEREAEKIPEIVPEAEIKNRKDFRNVLTFTIDPEDAKDFDDAISVQPMENGLWEIGVHIADVSHYVRPGTQLDDEAYNRGTSIYLVDRVVPMLPEKLSNGVCSLRPKEDKLCFSAVFVIDEKAHVHSEWFGKTVIHSNRRFAYEEVQEILENGKGEFSDELLLLNRIAHVFRKQRFKEGAISFETQEVKFKLDESGHPIGVYTKVRKDAHKLIEDFMLLANRKVAELMGKHKRTCVYRVHEAPNIDKLSQFGLIAGRFGYRINVQSDKSIAKSLNSLLDEAEGKPEQNLLQQMAIRTMAKAYYSTKKTSHYGLAFDYYSHFTSPIRRYPDLMTHRELQSYLEHGANASATKLEANCKHSSDMEQKAAEAERASIRYKQVEYLNDSLGQVFPGIISGVTEWGIYVELEDNKCEGMIRLSSLQDDYYVYDEANMMVVGKKKKIRYQLGDKVKVKVIKTDLVKRTIDFQLVK
ncbi:MAG: ribonuclease R [Bacteroidia bacterium]|nr:ribonuclease R [Bacteroidia bacterium]MBP7260805.1 ribonuclease R [Bacteroidia bacterium]MBP9180283.1 ribonuclease R [Bacteroidia bacterium]MBP9724657.1 ribonuclease R [Bacteroidia bacterium]